MSTWYVSAAGAGNKDGTSYIHRWDGFVNITWGVGGVVAGDILYICDTFTGQELTVGGSGTSGNYIYIKGDYTDHAGVIDATGENHAIHSNAEDYIYLTQLTVHGADGTGANGCNIYGAIGTAYWVIDNVETYNAQRSGIWFLGATTHDNTFQYITARNNGSGEDGAGIVLSDQAYSNIFRYNTCYSNAEDGIGLGGTSGEASMPGNDNVVEYNYCYSNGEDGLDIKGNSGSIIRFNKLINNDEWGVCIWEYSDNVTFAYNYVGNNAVGGIKLYAQNDLTGGHKIYYNIVEHNGGTGSSSSHGLITSGDWTNQVLVYGNTFYINPNSTTNYGDVRIADQNVAFKNNIIVIDSNSNHGLLVQDKVNVEVENNLYYALDGSSTDMCRIAGTSYTVAEVDDGTLYSGEGYEENGIGQDPLLTDVGSDDYTLTGNSPCIDTGVDLGSDYNDALDPASSWPDSVATLDQNDYGAEWEIGAFVYDSGIRLALVLA